jgi:hypothetical protein
VTGIPWNEVVEALGDAELRHAEQRGVDEEQLLVGSELGLIEDPRQDDRNRKRRSEPDRSSNHDRHCGALTQRFDRRE